MEKFFPCPSIAANIQNRICDLKNCSLSLAASLDPNNNFIASAIPGLHETRI